MARAFPAACQDSRALHTELNRRSATLNDATKRRAAIAGGQGRLRQAPAAVPGANELQRRCLGISQNQETTWRLRLRRRTQQAGR